jgi:hypothetical protein
MAEEVGEEKVMVEGEDEEVGEVERWVPLLLLLLEWARLVLVWKLGLLKLCWNGGGVECEVVGVGAVVVVVLEEVVVAVMVVVVVVYGGDKSVLLVLNCENLGGGWTRVGVVGGVVRIDFNNKNKKLKLLLKQLTIYFFYYALIYF